MFDLRRSVWLVPLSHAVIGLPFVLASVVPALRSIDPRLREAAATLGARRGGGAAAGRLAVGRGAALVTGAGFSAAVSLGEFGATSFLAGAATRSPPRWPWPGWCRPPGAALRGQALALSVVIGAVVAALAAVIECAPVRRVTLL